MQLDPRTTATPRRASHGTVALAVGAIALAILLGAFLRMADPLSSPVVPAEDPYTHMALVKEHLRTGELNPLNEQGTVYPPGLHGFLAAAWVYTGSDLYGQVLFGPVLFGAIGILGMAILLWRTAGPVAGFVAALAMAVAPEAIFRSNMMSPTAMDLAILPFFLYALLRVLAGRLGWVGVAAPMAVFLALAHPWLLAILSAAGLAFIVCAILFPASASRAKPTSMTGLVACIAVLGSGLAIAFMMPSFGGILNLPHGTNLIPLGLGIAVLALAPSLVMVLSPRARAFTGWFVRAPPHLAVRLGLSLALAVALVATTLLAIQTGMPAFVDLPRSFGWPVLVLAFAAIVALPFIASPIANLAASLFAATYPFVVFNPLNSEFLPHRTAIFLGVALAALAGVAAGALVRAAAHAMHRRAAAPARPARRSARPFMLAAPALLICTLLGGAVYAGTPDAYPGGWYRLYNPCELDALRDVARQADLDPNAIVIVGDWQAKLVLAALTNDAGRVWYKSDVFTSEEERGDLVATMSNNGRPLIVVMDRYLRVETPDAETSFAASPPWHPIGSWCAGMGIEQPRIEAYATTKAAA